MRKIFIATGVLVTVVLSVFSVSAQTQSRDDILKAIQSKRAELSVLEKLLLSPSEVDRSTYADFLRQPDTGLIRLLPREDKERSLTMFGGGAYYSFSRLTHEYGAGSDISLEQGYLQTGFAGANYGMLTSLGEVPLENVTLETTSAHTLASHTPPTEEPQARVEQRRASDGATIEGTNYKNRLLAKVNSTYLVRSINYDASDSLVAFKVVRIDNDNSVLILWKLLKKYPTPYLARNE